MQKIKLTVSQWLEIAALTYSQHALTKHQIGLIDTIIARISGQE